MLLLRDLSKVRLRITYRVGVENSKAMDIMVIAPKSTDHGMFRGYAFTAGLPFREWF
jgi:hypothetical protein